MGAFAESGRCNIRPPLLLTIKRCKKPITLVLCLYGRLLVAVLVFGFNRRVPLLSCPPLRLLYLTWELRSAEAQYPFCAISNSTKQSVLIDYVGLKSTFPYALLFQSTVGCQEDFDFVDKSFFSPKLKSCEAPNNSRQRTLNQPRSRDYYSFRIQQWLIVLLEKL